MGTQARHTVTSTNDRFLANFIITGSEFYDLVELRDGIGFSVKKKRKGRSNYISLLKVALLDDATNAEQELIPVFVAATYGKLSDSGDGISIRDIGEKGFRSQPIDIQSRNDYQYRKSDGKIYKDNEVITGLDLLRQLAKAHGASWISLSGLSTRARLEFWRLSSTLLQSVSGISRTLLLAISGTRYSYDPILAAFEEESNRLDRRQRHGNATTKSSKTIEFLGYKASAWSVVFYCFSHLFLCILFFQFNLRLALVSLILKNNFLTVTYVVASLWLIEWAIPYILEKVIKQSSIKAFDFRYHIVNIKI